MMRTFIAAWRQLARGMRALFHRAESDAELADEVEQFLDAATDDLVARGASPSDARRAATLAMGNATVAREQIRDYGWEQVVATLSADVRYAARRLRASPAFTAVCVATLALGIGASTAIFSAVDPILFRPLPYPGASRILAISDLDGDGAPLDVTYGTFLELARRTHSFDALAVMKPWRPTIAGDGEPERLEGQAVSAQFFRTLGVAPRIGRDFTADDDRVNGPKVVILSDALWRRRFGADPAIVGRTIELSDVSFLVIGVMPLSFENVLAPNAAAWMPLQYSTVLDPDGREWGHHLRMIGRLRAGVTPERARDDLAAIASTPFRDFPRVAWASLQRGLVVEPLQLSVTHAVRPALLAVLGAVLLVLAIACVNVVNLLLGRGALRRGEFAVRIALGAARGRLVRQVLTETMLLAGVGGLLALAVGEAGVRALVALSPPGLPRVADIRMDTAVFVFALALTTLVGLLVGIVPAIHASRGDPGAGLQRDSRRTTGGHERTRRTLVVAEVALALTLLVGAGLLLRSLRSLLSQPVGFDASGVLTMQMQESGNRYASDATRYQTFAAILDEVRRMPGVSAAAVTSQLPLSGDLDNYGVHFENDPAPASIGAGLRYAVTPDYFGVMRIPLRRGRLLDAHDGADAPHVALVNESLAARKFPNGRVLGRRLHFGTDDGSWYTIVGVVGDVKQTSLALGADDAIYITPTQWHWVDPVMSLVVRSRGDAAALAPSLRSAIWSVDPNLPILRVATMEQLVARTEANRRFALILFELFGVVSLVLAATGIYGVLSGSITERTREIGIRTALGAAPRDIHALVLGQGMSLTALGVLLGLGGAFVASRAIASLLFSVTRLDPTTYAGVVALLVGVSAIACWLPAARAARVDPASTLRND